MPLKDPEARREYNRLRYASKREEQRRETTERYRNDPIFRESVRARAKAWYEANKERARQQRAEYYAEHKQQKIAASRAWKKANPERVRESNKKSDAKRHDQIRKRRREYTARNRAKLSQKNAEYYQRTKEKRLAYGRDWWKKNYLKAREYANARRTREAGIGGRHAAEDAIILWEHYGRKCAVDGCKNKIEPSGKRHGFCIDHIIPISRGGTNDFANLQVLCKSHNSQKKNRTNEEWADLFNVKLRDVPPKPIT